MEKKIDTVLIHSGQISIWGSCRVITPNLLKSARDALIKNEIRFDELHLNSELKLSEIKTLATRIVENNYARVIFVDHAPHPELLLSAISYLSPKYDPQYFFHIYGDFTFHSKLWSEVAYCLRGKRTRFICASPRQINLVQRFLEDDQKNLVSYAPFPIDSQKFYCSQELRTIWREKNHVPTDEILFVYTGRLSMQKNILQLLDEFARFLKLSGMKARLVLAGQFDNLGVPWFGVKNFTGQYYQYYSTQMKSYPAEIREKIHYFGELSSTELLSLYNASDVYISLSMHHDEDFGMSPLEALCCGSSTILTSWGGYAAYDKISDANKFVPIRIEGNGLHYSSNILLKRMIEMSMRPYADRKKLSETYLKLFNIEACTELLSTIYTSPQCVFKNWNSRLTTFSERPLFKRFEIEKSSSMALYKEIYSAYVENEVVR